MSARADILRLARPEPVALRRSSGRPWGSRRVEGRARSGQARFRPYGLRI